MSSALYLHLYTETPVHAGGTESTGAIDLPVQREAATTLPLIWGQSLKGAIKQRVRDRDPVLARRLLGSEPGEPTTPGTLDVLDAMLVAFPVASLHSTFCWVTCRLVLDRLRRRQAALGQPTTLPLPVVADDQALTAGDQPAPTHGAYGPFALRRHAADPNAKAWAGHLGAMLPEDPVFDDFRRRLGQELTIVSDTVFGEIALECTDIQARVQLHRDPDRAKTVQNGPFYAEYLPTDTLLSATVLGPAADLDTLKDVIGGTFWLGGHESVGKGLLWCRPVMAVGAPA